MKFLNKGEDTQIRIPEGLNRFRWECVRKGEIIDFPKKMGLANGFEIVADQAIPQDQGEDNVLEATEGKIGETKVETKQIEVENKDTREGRLQAEFVTKKKLVDYKRKLILIKGISSKTAKDIIEVFPTEEDLMKAISNKESLPFRDDRAEKLREKYE